MLPRITRQELPDGTAQIKMESSRIIAWFLKHQGDAFLELFEAMLD